MLRLLLIRHGVTEWNLAGRLMGRIALGLAEEGRAQIRRQAEALADVPIDDVFSSPQQRTQESAALIAAPHGLAIHTAADLDEVWLAPHWQGRTFQEIRDDPEWAVWRRDPSFRSAAFEASAEVQARVVRFVEQLSAMGTARTVALVSHGDPLRLLLAHFLCMPLADYRRLTVETGSISVVVVEGPEVRVPLLSWRPGTKLDRSVLPSVL